MFPESRWNCGCGNASTDGSGGWESRKPKKTFWETSDPVTSICLGSSEFKKVTSVWEFWKEPSHWNRQTWVRFVFLFIYLLIYLFVCLLIFIFHFQRAPRQRASHCGDSVFSHASVGIVVLTSHAKIKWCNFENGPENNLSRHIRVHILVVILKMILYLIQ